MKCMEFKKGKNKEGFCITTKTNTREREREREREKADWATGKRPFVNVHVKNAQNTECRIARIADMDRTTRTSMKVPKALSSVHPRNGVLPS